MLNISKIKELLSVSKIRTEKDFTELCGFSVQAWQVIKKTGRCTKDNAQKISKVLGVEIQEILEEEYYYRNKRLFEEKGKFGISERIKELIEELGINLSELSKETGIPRPTISTVLTRDSANIDFLYSIAIRYKWLNIRWLLTGEGSIREPGTMAAEDRAEYESRKLTIIKEKQENLKTQMDILAKELIMLEKGKK
jgi:transcriptional regulator with XRE-family HTH domain